MLLIITQSTQYNLIKQNWFWNVFVKKKSLDLAKKNYSISMACFSPFYSYLKTSEVWITLAYTRAHSRMCVFIYMVFSLYMYMYVYAGTHT